MEFSMKSRLLRLAIVLAFLTLAGVLTGCEPHRGPSTAMISEPPPVVDLSWIEYPEARRGNETGVYHGVEVADPYRWMEDEGSEETQTWLAKQDAIAERFFDELPKRQAIEDYLEHNWIDGVVSVPVRKGDRTFTWKAVRRKSHDVLYAKVGAGEPTPIFDLN